MFFAKENRLWMQISAPEIEKTGKSCYTEKESQRKEQFYVKELIQI